MDNSGLHWHHVSALAQKFHCSTNGSSQRTHNYVVGLERLDASEDI